MKYPYICDITLKRLTMKRLRLGLWACFCFCAATTLMGQNKVKTTAEKVMLFIDGAQVTRTKQVDIPAGNSTLIFTGLSPYMDAQSMQVSANRYGSQPAIQLYRQPCRQRKTTKPAKGA